MAAWPCWLRVCERAQARDRGSAMARRAWLQLSGCPGEGVPFTVQDLQALVHLPGGVDFLEGAGALTRERRGQLLLIPVAGGGGWPAGTGVGGR